MSIKKQYSKTRPICKVTFSYPEVKNANPNKVQLLGEFNEWDPNCKSMRKNKNGVYSQTLELELGKEYQYKYLIEGANWENDPNADKLLPNEFASENSVVVI